MVLMKFALDKDGKRVYIDSTHVKNEYFCPGCGEKLILKKGNVRTHHFAHSASHPCTDDWHYDMSEWHQRWQAKFPDDYQEVVKISNGKKHRADVLMEDKKVVLEFQHSPLSSEEFEDRNSFYKSLGYKIVWVFDVTDQIENETIENYSGSKYKWNHPKKVFDCFIPQNDKNVILYFQTQVDGKDNTKINEMKALMESSGIDDICGPDGDAYIRDHENDNAELIKVTWAPESGFERFATDGKCYTEGDIVDSYFQSDKDVAKANIKLNDLYDSPIEIGSKDHTTYYFGCPKSTTHKCCSSIIDVPESQYNEISPCCICQYRDQKSYETKCRYRFKKIGLQDDTLVKVLSRNKDGFINEISYEKDGKEIQLDIPTYSNDSFKSVFELWKDDYKVAIFKNAQKNYFIKLNRNPKDQVLKYGKVYGWFSYDQYSFPNQSKELYYCDSEVWICVWHIER